MTSVKTLYTMRKIFGALEIGFFCQSESYYDKVLMENFLHACWESQLGMGFLVYFCVNLFEEYFKVMRERGCHILDAIFFCV